MVVAYPPFFPSQILDDAGQPVANGRVLAYFAGSDVPAPLFSPDGTALGSSVTLNTAGEAVFCLRAGTAYRLTCLNAQGATVWTRDNVRVTTSDSGMANPMEEQADLIVGAVDGQPERLAAPANASFLRSYKNSDNVPVVKWSQLKAGANITITDAGTQVTVAADTQEGDHLAKGTPEDTHPGDVYTKMHAVQPLVKGKLNASDGQGGVDGQTSISINADGVPAGHVLTADGDDGCDWAAPATQPGDHHVLVTGADASAGTLADKLVAGSNVTLTPVTDGDGVQTLRIDAAGVGGIKCTDTIPYCCIEGNFSLAANTAYALAFVPTQDVTINKIRLYGTFPAGQYRAAVYLNNTLYSYSATSTVLSGSSNTVIMDVPDTTIPLNGGCWLAFCGSAASTIRGKSGGLNNFSRKTSISPWTWPATPSNYGTALTDVAYYQIWYE